MTSHDDIERRLRALPELIHAEVEARVAARAGMTFEHAAATAEAATPASVLLSAGLIATAVTYIGWAIDFAIALYR